MLEKTDNLLRDEVLAYIEQANDLEIQEIMGAVERRFRLAHPDWDVVYAAVHKDPKLRREELNMLAAYIEKDIKWHEETAKKDSLG